jgi:parallel beta-helix repeat protein
MPNPARSVVLFALLATAAACADGTSSTTEPSSLLPADECSAATRCTLLAAGTQEDVIQSAFATAEPGSTLQFAEGTFTFRNQLIVGASDVSVVGAGIDSTVLDFVNQASGSEGIFAQNVQNLRLERFTVKDTLGNGVKVLGAKGVVFRQVKAYWTGPDPSAHGAYGLYPVQSEDVLIEGCVASGASDSGLYVGQSNNVIVRNNEAFGNVAGIEIENTVSADVYANDVHDNTGGILVFDLPDLQQLGGHAVRVYENDIHDNNTTNFAPPGNIVGSVPAGTGSFVMANHDVEIFGNEFTNNGTGHLAVVSYFVTSIPIKDPNYYPYPARVSIHDNTFTAGPAGVDTNTQLGLLLLTAQPSFPGNRTPDVIYDGITDPAITTPAVNPMQICVRQPGSHFANLHLDQLNGGGSNLSRIMVVDPPGFDCTLPPLSPVTLPAGDGGAP